MAESTELAEIKTMLNQLRTRLEERSHDGKRPPPSSGESLSREASVSSSTFNLLIGILGGGTVLLAALMGWILREISSLQAQVKGLATQVESVNGTLQLILEKLIQ
jgi:hypothetical protein